MTTVIERPNFKGIADVQHDSSRGHRYRDPFFGSLRRSHGQKCCVITFENRLVVAQLAPPVRLESYVTDGAP